MADWSRIKDGARFQALVCALIVREFPQQRILVFNRPGRDDGLDAISGDGLTVYQAKFVGTQRFSSLQSAIKKELKAIAARRSSGDYWSSVRRWVLLTNILVNRFDTEKWKSEFVPRFKELGVEPTLVGASDLEQWLVEFPG